MPRHPHRILLRTLLFLPLSIAAIAGSVSLSAQAPAEAARQYVSTRKPELTRAFSDLLAIPDVASDPANLEKNAATLEHMLAARGAHTQLLRIPNVPPIVYGEITTPGATHTIVFYAHYDGQPVTPSEWKITQPFTPLVKDADGVQRIYGRAASDDKAAIFAQLTALDALKAARLSPHANLRFVWEGEEEVGSPHLEEILNAHRDIIHGDVWLICDGPVDQSGRQTVVFGARGDTHIEITLYGPSHGLHSGHYGNWAPNPAMMLAQLLAKMKDDSGHVLIPHFYDGITPLSALEKDALAQAPDNDAMLKSSFALGHTDGNGAHVFELINQPSLNINGLSSGQTGPRATNMIPPTAIADLDLRLVVGVDWKLQQQRVVEFVRQQGYFVTTETPTREELLSHPRVARIVLDPASYNAVRTPMDLPIAQEVIAAVKSARGDVVLLPTMGGSVPLGAMVRAADTHTITVPIANYDNNQHSSDENIRLDNLWKGVETMAALLEMR